MNIFLDFHAIVALAAYEQSAHERSEAIMAPLKRITASVAVVEAILAMNVVRGSVNESLHKSYVNCNATSATSIFSLQNPSGIAVAAAVST